LKHVKHVTIIGDELLNDDVMDYWSDWGERNVPAFIEDRETGEQKRVDKPGTLFTDFSRLSVLTGLEELNLWWQPLTDLEGIQALENLRSLKVEFCPQLTDVSAAFTLQGLRMINFERYPVASLQGVQNLYDLEMLEICNTKITSLEGIEGLKHLQEVRVAGTNIRDFSPLGQVDFTWAAENRGGVSLALNVMNSSSLPQDAYAFLEGIPGFSQLEFPSVSAKLWLDHLAGKPVKRLNADDCGFTNEQFRAFVEAHPELEEVQISWNQQLTDVSCLLALENLRKVQLSSNMTQAKASLGAGYGFELKLD
jgi:Leucine-rich repeat (LRR) protein